MSEKFGLMGLATQQSQYLDGRAVLNCGDDTATEVDHEVMELLHRSYEEAKRMLIENREALDKIAEFLIERETITGKEFMKIFRQVKGIPEPEETQKTVSENRMGMKDAKEIEELPTVIELPQKDFEEPAQPNQKEEEDV